MIFTKIKKVIGTSTLNDVLNIISNYGQLNQEINDDDWPAEDILIRKITICDMPESINEFIIDSENRVSFLYVSAYSEKDIRKGYWFEEGELRSKEERVKVAKSDIVFMRHSTSIYAIFLTKKDETVTRLVNELLIKDHWGEIVDAIDFQIEDDLLYWLVYRRIEHQGGISQTFEITRLSAYLGLSIEETHRMYGEGERIYELLGTMAYLFGNEPLKSIKIGIRLLQENCTFMLDRSGSCEIIDTEYIGNYCGDYVGNARKARLCLLVYTIMVPSLLNKYTEHIDSGLWNSQQRQSFINNTGMEIIRRVLATLQLPGQLTVSQIQSS